MKLKNLSIGDPRITRAYLEPEDDRAAGDAGDGGPIKFVASTKGVKRDGLDLDLAGLDTANYEKNPVFLWVHNYAMPPLGKVTKIRKLKNRMEMWVQFDQADEFAVDIERKYREGYLTAVSIGWIITEFERGVEGVDDYDYLVTGSDLLDLSAVPVPGDPDALMPRELAAVRSIAELRTTSLVPESVGSPAHGSGTADSGFFVDADGRRVEVEDLVYQISEPERAGCEHLDDDGDVDWKRTATDMVGLLADGTSTTDDDRETTYRHLERHYRKIGRTPPELLAGVVLEAIPVRSLVVEGEWVIYQEGRRMNAEERMRKAAEEMRDAATEYLEVTGDDETEEVEAETSPSLVDVLGELRDAIVLPEEDDEDVVEKNESEGSNAS